ncbi:MAG: murein peptide amidase, partial [Actinomycetota bacterium]|nr:murein peptide amidase [Actinomycetota bacterium]
AWVVDMRRMPLQRAAWRGLVAGLAIVLATAGAVTGAGQSAATDAPVMTTVAIGKSVQGRTIWALHRAYPGATQRVIVIGAIHGDEVAGMGVTWRLEYRNPFPRNLDLWLIPTVNPDGVAAHTRTNAHKVDLNRNFPYNWRRINVGTSTYSGPSAASEPETKAVIAFINKINPRITIVFHQPLNGVGRNTKRMDVVNAVASAMVLPVKSFSCTTICYGSFTSWHNYYKAGVAVTVEFPSTVTVWRKEVATSAVLSVGSRY